MRRQGQKQRFWVALVAAYLLAAQSLLSAYAASALAAPVQPDAAGFIICSAHGIAQPPGDDQPDPRQTVNHCQWACSVVPVALLPPDGVAGGWTDRFPAYTVSFRSHIPMPSPGREGSPGNPRAPPQA